MPKGIDMLANAALKQLKEDTIQKTIDGTLDFLSAAYIEIEKLNEGDEIKETIGEGPLNQFKRLDAVQ